MDIAHRSLVLRIRVNLAIVTHCTFFAAFGFAFRTIDQLCTRLVLTVVTQTERVARFNVKLSDLLQNGNRVFFSWVLLGDSFELAIHAIENGMNGFYLLGSFGPCYVGLIVTSCP